MWKRHISGLTLCAIVFAIAFCLVKPDVASANSYYWGFTKSKDGKPVDAGANFDEILKNYGAFYTGDPNKNNLLNL